MLQTHSKRKIRDVVVEGLRNFIVAEQLVPGDRLPNEGELASRFGVSRVSVREATKALEMFGVVESKTGVGLKVGQIDLGRMTEHLGFHSVWQTASEVQLIDSRIAVETGALPFAMRRIAKDQELLVPLQETVDQLAAAREPSEWYDLDFQFHRQLLETSDLAPLVTFGELLRMFFARWAGFPSTVERIENADCRRYSVESHQRIVDAVRSQDVALASDELRQHIESHKRLMGTPESTS